MQPVGPFDLEGHGAGKLQFLARFDDVFTTNLGGETEKWGFGKILARGTENLIGLRGNIGLLLRGCSPSAEHQAATDN
jgi:hypothetical protein